jgi:hypothetical protein
VYQDTDVQNNWTNVHHREQIIEESLNFIEQMFLEYFISLVSTILVTQNLNIACTPFSAAICTHV